MTTPEKLQLLLELGIFTDSEINTLCMVMGMYHNTVKLGPPEVRQTLGRIAAAAFNFDRTNYPGDAEKWFIEIMHSKDFRDDPVVRARVERFFFALHQCVPELDPTKFAKQFRACLEG